MTKHLISKIRVRSGISSNNGASFGPAIRISNNAYLSLGPSVATSGSYVYVAWDDNTPVSGSGSKPEISRTCKAPVGLGIVLDTHGSSLPISWLNLVSLGPRTADHSS